MGGLGVLACLLVGAGVDDAKPSPADVRRAVEASLVYLQDEALDWLRDRKCASCHHAPMAIWASEEARARGFSVDREILDDLIRRTLDDPVEAKLLSNGAIPSVAPGERKPFALSTAYGLLAAAAVPEAELSPAARKGRDELRSYIEKSQNDDGSWTHGGGRPPMLESEEIMTLDGALALALSGPADGPALSKAREWLETRPAGSLQARLLRLLLGAGRKERPPDEAIHGVLSLQNADGGWSQTAGMGSDAYATGQALYALARAGVPLDRPEIEKARAFLVATQTDDGSWQMASRPQKEGDEPAKDVGPITMAGTAWAALGLARTSAAADGAAPHGP